MEEDKKDQWIQEPVYTVNGQRVVKRYRKIRIVGEGSYSKCWLVHTSNSDSFYVAKIIPKKKLQLLVKQKLVYEIRIHQQLSHPHVVHLDHWFEDEQFQYILMEYCSEGNLQKRLQNKSKLSQKDISYYARQIVQAISYLHSKNILHRDLKLCNFYIDDKNQIKLGDFGFACQLSHPNQLKRQTCGTPNFIAPEAISGFGYSFSSDVWAIGVILYRLKFKICPFEGRSVKQTLEKVKTCQYTFPKKQSISSNLKDLIEKIFVINYDDRLSLNQILNHPFFQDERRSNLVKTQSQSKGFSIIRNIFSRDKQSTEKKSQRNTKIQKNQSKQKQQTVKRSNSCETSKQIKQIFKNKSKGTLTTSMNTDLKTQESSLAGSHVVTQSGREKSSIGGSTMRSIAETTLGMSLINKRLVDSNPRVNNFIGNVKQQMKMHVKNGPQVQKPALGSHQLTILTKKFYFPYEIQFQKDFIIIHYKNSIKQIIHSHTSYLLHRTKQHLYDMTGSIVQNYSKVMKYIIENRIEIACTQPQQQEYGQYTVEKILLFVSHKWIIMKDGIILRFGTSGIFVGKMMSQQLFYIGSAVREQNRLKQDGKTSLMYLRQGKLYKCAEGVVLNRIYQGWIANAFKQSLKD